VAGKTVSVAFITSMPRYGGGEKWMLQAGAAMARRGHDVCLISTPGGEITRRASAWGLATCPVAMGGWLDPATLWELGRILRRRRIEVACVNVDKEIRQASLAGFVRPGLRIVPRRGSPDPIKNNWHYRFVYQNFVNRLIINCQALIPKVCDGVPWFDRDKIRVVYNGCDAAALAAAARPGRLRSELHLAPDRPIVSLVGEVGRRKGQDILLETAARLRSRHPAVVYLVVGEGEGDAALQQESHRRGLDDGTVRFLGFREDIPDILIDTDVLVLPSRSEGFPNALLEGMAMACPVVATRVDGIPELVRDGETGTLVAAGDVEAFTAALARLLDDPAQRRAWGEAGRRRAREDFSEQRMIDALESCLLEW
jgi:glycosyltransferase involved in cell wall biosynthesis